MDDLLLDTGGDKAVDEATLEQQEEQEQRRDDEQGTGRDYPPGLRSFLTAGEGGKPDGEWPLVWRIDYRQRPQKLVPMRRYRDDGESEKGRHRQRNIDVVNALNDGGPVDQRRIL